MKPLEFDRRYGELDQVISAHLGQFADADPGEAGPALQAYLRHTWHTRPWALGNAEKQLREYARNPPGRLRQRLGEFYAVPDVGLPESEIQGWLLCLAEHIQHSVEEGQVPPPAVPDTHWEWRARFPELAQLLSGWFSQDMPDEFADQEALADYAATTNRQIVARLVGELQELLALELEESECLLALTELGVEVEPPAPYSPSTWLTIISERLTG